MADRDNSSPPTPRWSGRAERGFDPVVWLATGSWLGLAPVAPGTVGSLWGLPLAWSIGQLRFAGFEPYGSAVIQLAAIITLGAVGVPLCTAAARRLNRSK